MQSRATFPSQVALGQDRDTVQDHKMAMMRTEGRRVSLVSPMLQVKSTAFPKNKTFINSLANTVLYKVSTWRPVQAFHLGQDLPANGDSKV